jgi:hypothetical protein
MATQNGAATSSSIRPEQSVALRLVAYYALLAGAAWLLFRLAAADAGGVLAAALREVTGGVALPGGADFGAPPTDVATDPWALAAAAALATTMALALALPVSWVYVFTRQKKGFQQSLVHTLVLLPVIVAAVVVLVKHSLALAFSLAGVVAAVRFRNALDDSKDAAYLFLAVGLGLAAGVHVAVAIVLSVVFNLVVLGLWVTDYGAMPAPLEGSVAERRMQRALAHASRTGTFVARLDDEVLKALAPQQLEALADRAWRRRKRNAPDMEEEQPPFARLLRVRTRDPALAREVVDPVLAARAARWRFGGVVHEADGTHVVEYALDLRDPATKEELLAELAEKGGAHGLTADVR